MILVSVLICLLLYIRSLTLIQVPLLLPLIVPLLIPPLLLLLVPLLVPLMVPLMVLLIVPPLVPLLVTLLASILFISNSVAFIYTVKIIFKVPLLILVPVPLLFFKHFSFTFSYNLLSPWIYSLCRLCSTISSTCSYLFSSSSDFFN